MAELRTIPLAEVARACCETFARVLPRCFEHGAAASDASLTAPARALAGHNTAGDCWLVIHGKVYDVSQFMTDHPGGPESMLGACADARASARARCRAAPTGRACGAAAQSPLRLFPASRRVEFAGRNATSGFEDSSHSSSARKMMAKCVSCFFLSFSSPSHTRRAESKRLRATLLRLARPRLFSAGTPLVWPKGAAKRRAPTAARRRRRPWAAPPRARRRRRTSRMRSRCSSCCLHCTGSSGKVPSDDDYCSGGIGGGETIVLPLATTRSEALSSLAHSRQAAPGGGAAAARARRRHS